MILYRTQTTQTTKRLFHSGLTHQKPTRHHDEN